MNLKSLKDSLNAGWDAMRLLQISEIEASSGEYPLPTEWLMARRDEHLMAPQLIAEVERLSAENQMLMRHIAKGQESTHVLRDMGFDTDKP